MDDQSEAAANEAPVKRARWKRVLRWLAIAALALPRLCVACPLASVRVRRNSSTDRFPR